MRMFSFLGLVVLLAVGCSLVEVQVSVVSERTALENQVLGSYNSLSEEVLLVASVRGVDPFGVIQTPPPKSAEQRQAIEAMQVIAFHADDVEAFKRLGWVGENNQGLLTPFSLEKAGVPEDFAEFAARYKAEEFQAVVQEVNAAREVIMRRVVEINENFTMEALPKIRSVFAKINAENVLPGEKVQKEDGSWMVAP